MGIGSCDLGWLWQIGLFEVLVIRFHFYLVSLLATLWTDRPVWSVGVKSIFGALLFHALGNSGLLGLDVSPKKIWVCTS